MKPWNETMLELRAKFDGLMDAEKTQMAASIAGQEAMSGFLAMVKGAAGAGVSGTAGAAGKVGRAGKLLKNGGKFLKGGGWLAALGAGIGIYDAYSTNDEAAAEAAYGVDAARLDLRKMGSRF